MEEFGDTSLFEFGNDPEPRDDSGTATDPVDAIFDILSRVNQQLKAATGKDQGQGCGSRYLTTEEAAEYLKVSASWLVRARHSREGPRWISLGDVPKSPIRYDVQDLDKWMAERRALTERSSWADSLPQANHKPPSRFDIRIKAMKGSGRYRKLTSQIS